MSWLFPYNKKAKQLIQLLGSINSTPDRTRTYTSETLDPKSSASTNSATGAFCVCKGKTFFLIMQIYGNIFAFYLFK